ncbi:MAG: hypothetical protein ABJZ55_24755 [Fuerstiella sp.]
MATPAQLLEAGAFLAPTAKLKDHDGIDTVSARSYMHPALADPIVRLTADNLATGDDIMMEFLGFGEPTVAGPIAKQRRQALGFPGWALVHDPDHARYALELVKEFRKEVRRANSKPGHAWEGLTEIAKRLGKSVAHFLPSFWEQTGREFIAVGNANYASRAFGKAREAESVHGLSVDEDLRQESFLEFALAGCVSAKALTQYGKDLLVAHEPIAAWEFMKNLTVRRTLGGLPPWTNACKDLAPLIKAAGKDPKQELPTLLELMIESPSMNRAAMGFWKSASPHIKTLAAKKPKVAGILLNLIPKSSSWSDPEIWSWLENLKSWGILENAWKTDISEEAGPNDGPAAWFHRLLEANSKCSAITYDVLTSMSDRLISDGTSLDLYTTHRWSKKQQNVDLDLLDLALSLKIPVADPSGELTICLASWASGSSRDKAAIVRPRDPLFVKQDKRFAQNLVDAVDEVAGDNHFENVAQGKVALKDAREAWLMKTLDLLCDGGMPDFDDKQASFVKKTRPATFQEFPKAAAKLKKLDPLPALINTLKTFVPAEYAWPKLEEVVDGLIGPHSLSDEIGKPKSKLLICGSFPDAIVSDGIKAVVVRGDEIIFETELKLPKNKKLIGLQYLDEDLKVIVKNGYRAEHFWNSKPKVSEAAYNDSKQDLKGPVLHLDGGGTFTGHHVLHSGDSQYLTNSQPGPFFHDGMNCWKFGWDESYNEQASREYDVGTAKTGRKSLPTFFEDFAKHGTKLNLQQMQLQHYPGLVEGSPLGTENGFVGFRSRTDEGGNHECESIDGRKWSGSKEQRQPTNLLTQPGTKRLLPMVTEETYRGFECQIRSTDSEYRAITFTDKHDTYFQGHVATYPDMFWHVLKIRDLETSKQLRKLNRKQVQTLVDAAAKDQQGQKRTKPGQLISVKNLNTAIKKTFPKLTDSRLQEAIQSIVLRYERRSRELLQQIKNRDPKTADKTSVPNVEDKKIVATIRQLGKHVYGSQAMNLSVGIADSAAFLRGETKSSRSSMATVAIIAALLEHLPAKVWGLFWKQADETHDEWRSTFQCVLDAGLCDLPGSFRMFTIESKDTLPFPVPNQDDDEEDDSDLAFSWIKGQSRFLISKDWRSYTILEYSKTGEFIELKGVKQDSDDTTFDNQWSGKQLKEFLTGSAEHLHQYPKLSFISELAADLKISVAEVSLIWFGFPKLDAYEANFMPKHLRTAMKLKTKEASAAKEALKMIEPEVRMDLLTEALDGKIAELWQDPPVTFGQRLKAAYQNAQPDVSLIPTEHSETFGKLLGYGVNRSELMKALSSPADHPVFSPKVKSSFQLDKDNTGLVHRPAEANFTAEILQNSALCIAWLSYILPVGHSSLKKLQPLYEALVKALSNPNLLIQASASYLWELEDDKARENLIATVYGKPKRQKGILLADDGTAVAALTNNMAHRAFRPAQLAKAADYTKVQQQLDASATREYVQRCDAIWLVKLVREKSFATIVSRLQSTKVPEGQYETNPVHSCPALVKKVAKAKELSEEGAAYYLQLLCLPDPTDRNVKRWNNWTPATLKKASNELLESNLVLEAKRARAGRKLFLPGGWEALKAPHLPLETWKLPLFNMYRDTYDRATPVLPLIVPLQPVHTLFEAGWKRITSGDEPRYEEV